MVGLRGLSFVSPVANGEVKRKLIERRKTVSRSSLAQPGLRASPRFGINKARLTKREEGGWTWGRAALALRLARAKARRLWASATG